MWSSTLIIIASALSPFLVNYANAAPASTPSRPFGPPYDLTWLYSFNSTLGETISFGDGPRGSRLAIPITGGNLWGPKLNGKILNLGADWGTTDSNGTFTADARYNLQTDDGANIYLQVTGPGQADGHPQTRIILETGSEKYWWVNNIVAVGRATLGNGWVAVDAWQVTAPK